MGLAWNTHELLAREAQGETPTGSQVEFHFLSRRKLFDETCISPDRDHSSAGEWVVFPHHPGFYSVRVVTRPVYALPQELCLSFDCFSREEQIGRSLSSGPPVEEAALEFGALLSVLVREPLVPLGVRRQDDKPIAYGGPYGALPSLVPLEKRPKGVNSLELAEMLKGLAAAEDGDARAALSAAERYHAALSISGFDLSTAYLLLVSAVETLAGRHYRDERFDFDSAKKWERVGRLLEELKASGTEGAAIEAIKAELVKREPFVSQKFYKFVADFLPAEFWSADEMHPYGYGLPPIPRDQLRSFLQKAYDARSKLAHAGTLFPSYVTLVARDWVPARAVMDALDIAEREKPFVPAFAWFERLTHHLIDEFLARVVAPDVANARSARREALIRTVETIANLPENARRSLEALARWTAKFLGSAVIGPRARNGDWAIDVDAIEILETRGLVRCDACTMEGTSVLKDRLVGEAVGEFFWGASENPFRGNDILEFS